MALTERNASRLLVISDIHGHGELLQLLLEDAHYDPQVDQLLLLGDYIDAALPATYCTLELIRELVQHGAKALPGNHEIMLTKRLESSKEMDKQLAESIEWIADLPLYIEEAGYLFVHAGIRPGIPLASQSLKDLTEIREDFLEAALDTEHTVVFGHTPTFKLGARPGDIWLGRGRIGIDTGAKHGHRLTLLDVHNRISYSRPAGILS